MVEIERKFLVKDDRFKKQSFKKFRITQGFLNTNPERIVRIRLKGDKGFITVKGKSSEDGLVRFEWEKEITRAESIKLLELCEDVKIDKTRYLVDVETHIFEIDVFHGENEGLVIAEIELNSEEENFTKPKWLGREVTGNTKYYNSQLSKQPYSTWT